MAGVIRVEVVGGKAVKASCASKVTTVTCSSIIAQNVIGGAKDT